MDLRPGDVFFVRYRGADLTHERLAIWPTSREGRTDWMVLTPDGDKYVERLDGTRTQDSPARTWGPTTTHAGLGGRQVYRFQHRPDNEELKEMILRGRSQLAAGAPRRAEVTTASGAVVGLAEFMGVGADVEAEAEKVGRSASDVEFSLPMMADVEFVSRALLRGCFLCVGHLGSGPQSAQSSMAAPR